MTKKTKIRIFKALMFARSLFLVLCGTLILLCAIAASGPSVWPSVIFFIAALVCFGISYACDNAVGGYKSPFYH
jgi:predicted Abi (CAAX) family protease